MLHIYGSAFSSPTNKVRYVANYLKLPFEFHQINLSTGEHRQPAFLKLNPIGKIPAINDDGFCLAESNAIVRYFADKAQSDIYPRDVEKRAKIDQWIDYATLHVMTALSRIMYNTYFYKIAHDEKDERSLQDGHKFIAQCLPHVENQLTQHTFIAGDAVTLADLVLIAALDTAELSKVDLTPYTHLSAWRKKLMAEKFYRDCHDSYADMFTKVIPAE